MDDETRAIARLPHLEIEIRHRRLPEEEAEHLAISMKATPSLAGFAELLKRQPPWPSLWLQPWLLWGQTAQAAWQPWLDALSAAGSLRSPRSRARLKPGAACFDSDPPRDEDVRTA